MDRLVSALTEKFASDQVRLGEPLSARTSFRIGGPADVMFFPCSGEELKAALDMARAAGVRAMVIGNGSNLLMPDEGFRGLVITLSERMSRHSVSGTHVTAEAGLSLPALAQIAQAAGLSGLEFAAGIPGSLGGGAAMNAGAYGGQLSDVLIRARVLRDGELIWLDAEELALGYRTSRMLRDGWIVTEAEFALTRDDPAEILRRMQDYNARRREKQPLNLPSAGSAFKRPEGHFAGALIEQAGLKGFTVGSAQVSEKHAGFIVNIGGATAADVLQLIEHVRQTVHDQSGVWLEPEVQIVRNM